MLIRLKPKQHPQFKAVLFPTLHDYREWANGRGSAAYSVNIKPNIADVLYTVDRILDHPSIARGDWAIAEYPTPRIHDGYTYIAWGVNMLDFELAL
jgi:hypothetical protein